MAILWNTLCAVLMVTAVLSKPVSQTSVENLLLNDRELICFLVIKTGADD